MNEFIFSKVIVIQDATLLQNKHLRYFFKKFPYMGTPILSNTVECLLLPLLWGGAYLEDTC